jgi:hypothetical protein
MSTSARQLLPSLFSPEADTVALDLLAANRRPIMSMTASLPEPGIMQALEGTLQRINYRQGELTVVAQCRLWHFRLARACKLYFNDRPNILRCFHPLDQVRVVYADGDEGLLIKELYAWER